MVSSSVSGLFISVLKLNTFSEGKRVRAMRHIFKYLLGTQSYGVTFGALKEFGVGYSFSRLLKQQPEVMIIHIMTSLRRFFNGERVRGLSYLDKIWLKRLKPSIKHVKVIESWPSEAEVLHNMQPAIRKAAFQLKKVLRTDTALSNSDIMSELNIKVMTTYRLYIYSYDGDAFNDKVLYRCLHIGIRSWVKDFLSERFAKKNAWHVKSLDSEQIEALMPKSMDSSDAVYEAKDTLKTFDVSQFRKDQIWNDLFN